jgi:hypothetical protein
MASHKQKRPKGKKRPKAEKAKPVIKEDKKLDHRKQLFNSRKRGPIQLVQLPAEMITRLWGILYDVDTGDFRSKTIPAVARSNPTEFYTKVVRPWLRRHPVFSDAEVRCSGRGLHVIVWFEEPVEFTSDGERRRWDGIVRALQAVLPTDPDAPGLTATTRELGSINSKNGVKVRRLHRGKPVSVQAVLDFFEQFRAGPFKTIMEILLGADRVKPCPICGGEDSTLAALDRVGICYGSCGKVELARLYDIFLKPRPRDKEE